MRRIAIGVICLLVLIVLGFVLDRARRRPSSATADAPDQHHDHAAESAERIKLSPQAMANLKLTTARLAAGVYYKTITLPGKVIDRPGVSDRGVVAPAAGVLTEIHRLPGDTVRPGESLFTLRLLSDAMQLAQTELLKANRESQITSEMKAKLTDAAASGGIAQLRITELDNQLRRLSINEQAYRLELQSRGLTPAQIDGVAAGKFVREMQILAPPAANDASELLPEGANRSPAAVDEPVFELQELSVNLGQSVQAGQMLCLLSDHRRLVVEGRAFPGDVPLLARAVEQQLPVDVEFADDAPEGWPPLPGPLTIHHIANTMDAASHTFGYYVRLSNQSRSYDRDGRVMLLWRFRPGQPARIHVRVEKLDNVFVVPIAAVAWEGPESYVFRRNGAIFDRRAVHVVYRDRRSAVIANDGSVPAGVHIAQNAAVELNRALKAGTAGGAAHHHDHEH